MLLSFYIYILITVQIGCGPIRSGQAIRPTNEVHYQPGR